MLLTSLAGTAVHRGWPTGQISCPQKIAGLGSRFCEQQQGPLKGPYALLFAHWATAVHRGQPVGWDFLPPPWWLLHGAVCFLHLSRPRSRWCRTSGNGTVPAWSCSRRQRVRNLDKFGSCEPLALGCTVFHTIGCCSTASGRWRPQRLGWFPCLLVRTWYCSEMGCRSVGWLVL